MTTTELTHEAILEMEAGEEMDCLVAERVMGWRLKCYEWCPSTNIADAWEVVEKALPHLTLQRHDTNPTGKGPYFKRVWWVARRRKTVRPWEYGACYNEAKAPTAPLAVCRAALLDSLDDEA